MRVEKRSSEDQTVCDTSCLDIQDAVLMLMWAVREVVVTPWGLWKAFLEAENIKQTKTFKENWPHPLGCPCDSHIPEGWGFQKTDIRSGRSKVSTNTSPVLTVRELMKLGKMRFFLQKPGPFTSASAKRLGTHFYLLSFPCIPTHDLTL